MSRFTKWIVRIRKMERSDAWTIAAFGLMIGSMIVFSIRGDSEVPTESSSISSFLLFHLAISLVWIGASAGVKSSTTGFEEKHALPEDKVQSSKIIELEFYPKDKNQLFERSDSLDSARNNLRTGTGMFLGIGAAISLWLLNTSLDVPITYACLLGSSLLLTLSAVIAVLFSFADVTKWYANLSINESLVGLASSEDDYIEQIQEVLLFKEDVLSRMRKSIGVGLLFFIVGIALAVFLPIHQVIPSTSDIFWTSDRLGFTSLFSGLCLLCFLILLSSMIVGRRYLGILGTADFD